jgi:hypothetical protein
MYWFLMFYEVFTCLSIWENKYCVESKFFIILPKPTKGTSQFNTYLHSSIYENEWWKLFMFKREKLQDKLGFVAAQIFTEIK